MTDVQRCVALLVRYFELILRVLDSYGASEGGVIYDESLSAQQKVRWYKQPVKRRYVVAFLAFFGFCVIYMLRLILTLSFYNVCQVFSQYKQRF